MCNSPLSLPLPSAQPLTHMTDHTPCPISSPGPLPLLSRAPSPAAEFGDYDEEKHTLEYLSDFIFLPPVRTCVEHVFVCRERMCNTCLCVQYSICMCTICLLVKCACATHVYVHVHVYHNICLLFVCIYDVESLFVNSCRTTCFSQSVIINLIHTIMFLALRMQVEVSYFFH